jgi:hypothetical protein
MSTVDEQKHWLVYTIHEKFGLGENGTQMEGGGKLDGILVSQIAELNIFILVIKYTDTYPQKYVLE